MKNYPIEKEDIQGILLSGYGKLKAAKYVSVTITDAKAFRSWLAAQTIAHGGEKPAKQALNIAFTAKGLQALQVEVNEANGFLRSFAEGMDTDHRNRLLGDIGENASTNWTWGARTDERIHVLLMMFAKTQDDLNVWYPKMAGQFEANGMKEAYQLPGHFLHGFRGHFGFLDGVSQPLIKGLSKKTPKNDVVVPGEFLIGYKNGYNQMPISPQLEGMESFGRNGSYMVFRQLEQHVRRFWDTMLAAYGVDGNADEAIKLASKMVGRWPNGKPLTLADTPEDRVKNIKDFGFAKDDLQGHKCPIGSHIRRTNPRDTKNGKPKTSIKINNRHRILRRGRPYGPPFQEHQEIKEMLKKPDDGQERGLNFICFNTNIERQFEFVQHTWSNNPKFEGLYDDVDPLTGVKESKGERAPTTFTVQASPVCQQHRNLPAFVTMKGGAYFFMPGMKALGYLGEG